MLICVVSVLIYVLIGISPRGPKSPEQSTGRASVLSPRTNMLICVLMDSHGRPVHSRPVCADGHTRTSCVCCQTPTDVLCVLNRQPTWAKITRTVHGKGQRAESKDQRADMCTDGQPHTSCVPRGPKSPEQSTGRATVLTTDPLCVLTETHGRPVCADGHPRTSCVHGRPVCADGHTQTHTDSHRRPVCAGGQPRTSCVHPTWAKITRTVHGKGQRAESKDQRADMCTDGQPQTSCVC
ncbi:unnamed protein product [Brassica rapa]|uniref:Secreted protein n=1 Tax=Brassica campestris TaxID=3711 RepID=A0A8D9DN33_BRACM|nr:unnamed protein product [Brassica rapa]